MKRKMAVASMVVMAVLFIAGLALIFASPSMGLEAGHAAVRRYGGSMDTGQFEQVISGSMHAYLIGGFVISLVGGMGLFASGCEVYRTVRWYDAKY